LASIADFWGFQAVLALPGGDEGRPRKL
jgi:hypothetical protein